MTKRMIAPAASKGAKRPRQGAETLPEPSSSGEITVSNCVDTMAFEDLPPVDRRILEVHFAAGSLGKFVDAQIVSAKAALLEIDPHGFDPETYHRLSKEFRLLWRFWTDFRNFMTDRGRLPSEQSPGEF